MRTIKVRATHTITKDITYEVETEEIVSDDRNAREAGRLAYHAIQAAFDGVADATQETEANE